MIKHKIFSLDDNEKIHGFITPWSIVHFNFGILGYLYLKFFFKKISNLKCFIITIIIHTIYEKKDLIITKLYLKNKHNYKNNNKNVKFLNFFKIYYNSLFNCIGDTLMCILGFLFISNFKTNKILIIIFTLLFYFMHTIGTKYKLA
tara:strand:- start:3638 stop:4075 length:438 start_codon:yes stop_codon:yes gene_type:complete